MKKVLFVATVVRLHLNMFHTPFLKWFHDQGWQVDAAANNDYPNPDDCVIPWCDNFYCMSFERSPLKPGNLKAYTQLQELLRREHYDIIHCHTPMGGVVARLAASASRRQGTKVIYTAHGFHFFKGAPLFNWLAYYPVERLLAAKTDLIITVNREDYDRARTFRAGAVAQVNGVGLDLSRFVQADPAQRAAVRRELGLRDGDIFAISVAQLAKGKNHQTLIRAMSRLQDAKFHLFIAGDGPMEQELLDLARELGVEDRLHLLGFRRDVYRLCSAADLFLFASVREGLPVAVMEAMACGLPVVASDIRGIRDLTGNGAGGILLPPKDDEGFARQIRAVLDDPARFAGMKARNLDEIKKYSVDAVTEQMAQLYVSLM